MRPTLCSRCGKNVAVIFITKIENGQTKNDGLCLKCARELHIKPVDDIIGKMGLSDEDLEGLTGEMMNALSGVEDLTPVDEGDEGSDDDGKTATFPFLNRLFGGGNNPDSAPPPQENRRNEGQQPQKGGKRRFLDNYCIDLTQRARDGKLDRMIGREEELERVIQILNRRQKNNPCLIGEPGVGKTAIAEGLAQRIAQGDVPAKLKEKQVFLLDLTALVAGTQFRGQFESRMKGLIEEIRKQGNVILVIDEVHTIVGAGDAEGSMNAANILKPALSRGEIQVIGATTFTEYRKHIEKDSALERRMSADPPKGQELTDEMLDKRYARIAELRSREMQREAELRELDARPRPALTVDNLARIIELWTKIPASTIREDELERLAKLDERLKAHIIGQDQAVDAVCAAIRRSRVGLKVKRKPVSFIFVGPTGVGKTELVKRLAADMFDSPESLIRLDMSEFMEKFAVSRIIGSPPGYVGYDEAGQLTEKIRRKPYSVVLFDEIEKAHPDVMNILLQILDDGHITDAQGRNVNIENTIIVMTTNAGSSTKSGSVGFGGSLSDMSRERAMKALNEFLRPEFINRVDEIVCFNQLTEQDFRGIAALMLGELRDVMAEKGVTLSWDDSLIDYLVKEAYSVTYGARNLRRTIQKKVEDEIARFIIDHRGRVTRNIHLSADTEQRLQITE